MPFLNGINWAVLMFHNGTNWLSYLNVRLFAPGWDLSHSTMTDKINSTSLKREGPAQRAQHSSWGWLKHVCRHTSLHPTHAVLCHLWPNGVSLQKLRLDMTKPEGPLASPMILLETLELGEATVCLLCPSKWRQMGSHKFLPSDPPNPAWGCSLTELTQMSPVYLVSAGNNSKPLTGVVVLQRWSEADSHLHSQPWAAPVMCSTCLRTPCSHQGHSGACWGAKWTHLGLAPGLCSN